MLHQQETLVACRFWETRSQVRGISSVSHIRMLNLTSYAQCSTGLRARRRENQERKHLGGFQRIRQDCHHSGCRQTGTPSFIFIRKTNNDTLRSGMRFKMAPFIPYPPSFRPSPSSHMQTSRSISSTTGSPSLRCILILYGRRLRRLGISMVTRRRV